MPQQNPAAGKYGREMRFWRRLPPRSWDDLTERYRPAIRDLVTYRAVDDHGSRIGEDRKHCATSNNSEEPS